MFRVGGLPTSYPRFGRPARNSLRAYWLGYGSSWTIGYPIGPDDLVVVLSNPSINQSTGYMSGLGRRWNRAGYAWISATWRSAAELHVGYTDPAYGYSPVLARSAGSGYTSIFIIGATESGKVMRMLSVENNYIRWNIAGFQMVRKFLGSRLAIAGFSYAGTSSGSWPDSSWTKLVESTGTDGYGHYYKLVQSNETITFDMRNGQYTENGVLGVFGDTA